MIKFFKIVSNASIEIILGAVILYFNLKAFLLYFLIIYFINSHVRTESLDIKIRMNTVLCSIMALTISPKLGISDEEFNKAISQIKGEAGKKKTGVIS